MLKKNLFVVLAFFLILFVPLSVIFAQELQNKESVVLPKNVVIDEDYFAAGESVTLSGVVNGDVYLAGGNIVVEGTINGDLFAAGGIINLRGVVSQDVRVAGGQLVITGSVGGNVTSLGGSVTIADASQIAGSLVNASGSLSVFGPIGKGATIGAGSANLGSTIGGNVIAGVGKLSLTPQTNIQGNLTYFSDEDANIQEGAIVAGSVELKKPPIQQKVAREKTRKAFDQFSLFIKIVYLSSLFVAGLLLLKFFPLFSKNIITLIQSKPWVSMGVGLLALILGPVVIFLLFLTVIGIPFGFVLLFAYFASMYFGKIYVVFFLGQKILSYFMKNASQFWSLLTGVVAYGVLISIPLFGWFVGFAALLLGIGVLVLQKKSYYLVLRSKKLL